MNITKYLFFIPLIGFILMVYAMAEEHRNHYVIYPGFGAIIAGIIQAVSFSVVIISILI